MSLRAELYKHKTVTKSLDNTDSAADNKVIKRKKE